VDREGKKRMDDQATSKIVNVQELPQPTHASRVKKSHPTSSYLSGQSWAAASAVILTFIIDWESFVGRLRADQTNQYKGLHSFYCVAVSMSTSKVLIEVPECHHFEGSIPFYLSPSWGPRWPPTMHIPNLMQASGRS
jgi:hypothetical protein